MPIVYGALIPGDRYLEISATRKYGKPDILRLFKEWNEDEDDIKELKSGNHLSFFVKHHSLRRVPDLNIYLLTDDKADNNEDDSSTSYSYNEYSGCTHVLIGLHANSTTVKRFDCVEELFSDHRKSKVHRRLERSGFGEFKPALYFHERKINGAYIKIKTPKPLP